MTSKGTGTQQKIVSWPLTIHPSPMHWSVLVHLWPNLSVFVVKWQNWALLNEIGYQFRRYAGSYLDKSWFSEEYEQQSGRQWGISKTGGETTPKTNLTENTNSDLRFFLKNPCILFSSWLLISATVSAKLGPSTLNLGYFTDNSDDFWVWELFGEVEEPRIICKYPFWQV